ncbi:MAG: formate--tetrahydrofolate ligase [Deltaproteobacteria bacterium]|nr:formate--tetrahydrofolate ligase [Deltaproteobacteria bacterium]
MTDIEIARMKRKEMKRIKEVATDLGIKEEELTLYGEYIAKVDYESILKRTETNREGKLIVVTATTPTPLGEGKTVTSIGLTQGIGKIGKKVSLCIRQPSLGPVFGIKGGASGGGYSQVLPMEEFNLHFTGDMYAVNTAHNLLCAMTEASVFHKNALGIDPQRIKLRRVIDINDRALRNIIIAVGGKDGVIRETGFDITPASEIMAILGLSCSIKELKERLSRIVVGYTYGGEAVFAKDIRAVGAMAVLLKDALKPNLIQTIEGQPVFVHTGPFGNIAHGNSSIIADKIALKFSDYVVTEAGFGADLGLEKFIHIKCRAAGYSPSCIVIVTSIRSLKMHGGAFRIPPGKILSDEIMFQKNKEALINGFPNLKIHIENSKLFGIPVLVAINKFPKDEWEEIELLQDLISHCGAESEISEAFERGGEGTIRLARKVVELSEKKSELKFLYGLKQPVREKIEILAKNIYRAGGVNYSKQAIKEIENIEKIFGSEFPICMAKTQLSISDKPEIKGSPSDYVFEVNEVRHSNGAGFVVPVAGEISTMPGLGSRPAAINIDISDDSVINGIF